MEIKCPKCDGASFYKEQKHMHTGIYCMKCKSWVKWLSKGQENLFPDKSLVLSQLNANTVTAYNMPVQANNTQFVQPVQNNNQNTQSTESVFQNVLAKKENTSCEHCKDGVEIQEKHGLFSEYRVQIFGSKIVIINRITDECIGEYGINNCPICSCELSE